MDNKEKIAFTLGANFGQTLAQLSYEKMTQWDYEGAMAVYKEALIGISDDQCRSLVLGKSVVECEEGDTSVNMVSYDSVKHRSYLVYRPEKEMIWKIKRVWENLYGVSDAEALLAIEGMLGIATNQYPQIYNTTILIKSREFGYVEAVLNAEKLRKNMLEDRWFNDYNSESFRCLVKSHNGMIENLVSAVETLRNNLRTCEGFLKFRNMFQEELRDTIMTTEMEIYRNVATKYIIRAKDYLGYQTEVVDDIFPVFSKVDAGFIDLDGNIFGMNGNTNELLHVQLAEHIGKKINLSGLDLDYQLDKLGYIKFHGCTFLRYCHKPITEAQSKAMCWYAMNYLDGLIGFEHETYKVMEFCKKDIIQQSMCFR